MPDFHPGQYVSWTFTLRGTEYKRFGCVMDGSRLLPSERHMVDIQASNGRVSVSPDRLTLEPDCEDAIVADQREIWGT